MEWREANLPEAEERAECCERDVAGEEHAVEEEEQEELVVVIADTVIDPVSRKAQATQ